MFSVETKRDNDEIPEQHEFKAEIFITNNNEIYTHQIEFKEHLHDELEGLDIGSSEYQDAHLSTKYMSKKFTGFGNIVIDTPKSFATS